MKSLILQIKKKIYAIQDRIKSFDEGKGNIYRGANKEKIFAEEWKKENTNYASKAPLLAYILDTQDFTHDSYFSPEKFSFRDAEVAASVITWLGTNVGQCFLGEVNRKIEKEQDKLKKLDDVKSKVKNFIESQKDFPSEMTKILNENFDKLI